jgi:glucosamine 6-phosphate synthetase-like amidotransferase/phosphosugar isomerase protein
MYWYVAQASVGRICRCMMGVTSAVLLGCAQTGSYAPNPITATYRLDNFSKANLQIVVRDLRAERNNSGRSRDLVDALKAAKERKATTIVLTSNGGATAARLADILLISAVQPERAARETVATRISQLAIVDVLCTALALKQRKDSTTELDPLEKEIIRVRTEEE